MPHPPDGRGMLRNGAYNAEASASGLPTGTALAAPTVHLHATHGGHPPANTTRRGPTSSLHLSPHNSTSVRSTDLHVTLPLNSTVRHRLPRPTYPAPHSSPHAPSPPLTAALSTVAFLFPLHLICIGAVPPPPAPPPPSPRSSSTHWRAVAGVTRSAWGPRLLPPPPPPPPPAAPSSIR